MHEVMQFKQYAATHFHTKHAQNSPPHITIVPPFKCSQTTVTALKEDLKDLVLYEESSIVQINGFGHFADKVIYLKIENSRYLQGIYQKVNGLLYNNYEVLNITIKQKFIPHITIANRDLSTDFFPFAYKYFSALPYQKDCLIESLAILKYEEHRWILESLFDLKSSVFEEL
ncbi:MAG: 2'-5' RNA ligase family protein [Saprospiraceae bacterium]|nr:2'-5' RNA ligase family protein [Saprospiraceae bacterium]